MKTRRRQGATLGLVAVCVLVIIVVGIGCFFLAKIFGGGREVANATDAGALNIAKNVMSTKDANVAVVIDATKYPDFSQCADPLGTNRITLLTYNRCVAQALLVAMNAQTEQSAGSTQAVTNARAVLTQLTTLGSDLKDKLQNNQLTSYFDNVSNDTRMWGNNPVKIDTSKSNTYVTAFMKPKQSTNIYFMANSLPGSVSGTPVGTGDLPSNWAVPASADKKPPAGTYQTSYMSGYDNITITGVGSAMGVPVFPQQNPHLVAKSEFDQASTAPNANIPPNAFSVASNSTESKSGVLGGAVAAAIVGAVKLTSAAGGAALPNYDWPAAIPGGYIEINNPAGNTFQQAYRGVDESTSIFNDQLWQGPGIDIGANGATGAAFSTDPGMSAAWAAYNSSTGSDSYSHDGSLDPSTHGYSLANTWVTSSPTSPPTHPSSNLDMAGIRTSGVNCKDMLYSDQFDSAMPVPPNNTPICAQFLDTMNSAYNKNGPSPNSQANDPNNALPVYSNVDIVKGQIIKDFQSGARNVNINAFNGGPGPNGSSGLGLYPNGIAGPNPTPHFEAPIQRTGTIDALLDQVMAAPALTPGSNCTKARILESMTQRCYEIKPDANANDILALWQQEVPMNKTFYIFLNTATNKLVISETTPPALKPNTLPDGNPNDTKTICVSNYGLTGNIIDVPISGIPADHNLHEVPYENHSGNLTAQDHASWVLSSGYKNLLGKLQFSNTTAGNVENFSRPN